MRWQEREKDLAEELARTGRALFLAKAALAARMDEVVRHRSLGSLRGAQAKKEVGALAALERPSPAVAAAAHLAWCFLRLFAAEAQANPKFVGPAEGFAAMGGGRVPTADWTVTRAVFSPAHNLAAALEKVTPEVRHRAPVPSFYLGYHLNHHRSHLHHNH